MESVCGDWPAAKDATACKKKIEQKAVLIKTDSFYDLVSYTEPRSDGFESCWLIAL